MTGVETAAGDDPDLLMECDEEEPYVLLPPHKGHEEPQLERQGEGVQTSVRLMDEQESNPVPVRIIPIPVQPVAGHSPAAASSAVMSAGSALGFMVNGRPVPLLPGGGGAELKLRSHPEGSASGFTTVQIPVTLTVHSPTGTRHINTTASLTATVTSSTAAARPSELTSIPDNVPIITGVVSGEAAQKVLNDHNVNFKPSPGSSLKARSQRKKTPSLKAKQSSSSRPPAPHKLLRKGELGPVSPPNCTVCTSQYKLIQELRGFMCLCSPAITLSLRNLKMQMQKQRRRSREKSKTQKTSKDSQNSIKVPKTRPVLPAVKVISPPQKARRYSDDYVSDEFPSPTSPSSTFSPLQQHESGPPADLPQGKLVILVEDFYYGCAPGNTTITSTPPGGKFTGPYHCIHCSKTLLNNIKLMNHMQEHVSMMSQDDGEIDSVSSCPHCFRHFPSPFRLQCHVEVVHSKYESTVTCKICEMAFDNEPAFLWHMKTTHKPGEMPYVCQVCEFRSSFYSDVWSHFQEAHANTRHLLCRYCLRVLRSNTCYQQHFARHQKKHVLSCEKCRLHFLYVKERVEHKLLHHKTHIIPPQLCGLKPGTKVTVRTYSGTGGSESKDELRKRIAPCKVVDVPPPPPTEEPPKRKPIESLGQLLSGLSEDRDSCSRQRCVECLSSVPELKVHFPSLVHCSLCKYVTCCSVSYANHMISNHATCRKVLQFPTIYTSDAKLSQTLKCASCTFSTCRGDSMANHLTERPIHAFAKLTAKNEFTCGSKQKQPEQVEEGTEKTHSGSASVSDQNGAFVPIDLVPTGQTGTQLSVKPLTYPSPLSFTPAMTIKILGPKLQPRPPPINPLSLSQLSVILSCLCHGISQTSQRYSISPGIIRSWISQQQRGLSARKWCWKTDKMAEWVLNRREQQLCVNEDILLLTAKATLGGGSKAEECYSWIVDFMLRHDLGLQTTNNSKLKSVRDSSSLFIQKLYSQIQSLVLPDHCWGCMDEIPVFINSDKFSSQNPAAFQLFGSQEDRPVFDIVLSALSDGTFLPPLVFFTGTSSSVPDGFPDNVLLETREEGFTDQDRLQIWIDKVWRSSVTSKCNRNSLLMVDVHRGHLNEKFSESLSAVKTDVAFIPSGCSCRLQPLDLCVTQVLRDFLQARWTQLVSDGGLEGLGLDQLALTLACWLSEISSTLNSQKHFLCRSFSLSCSLQPVEGRGEAARMITALTQILIQPLETQGPEPGQFQLLVVMDEERKKDTGDDQKTVECKQSGASGDRSEDEQEEMDSLEDELGFVVKSPSVLRQVFFEDSDQESFLGFPDD